MHNDGGYDDGYAHSRCFWGIQPGRLVRKIENYLPKLNNLRILDAGCGEGKNAIWLARKGASILAVDVSKMALSNAYNQDLNGLDITFCEADFVKFDDWNEMFDVCIAYGLMHCLPDKNRIVDACEKLKNLTKPGGFILVCALNNRRSIDVNAHPVLNPCLKSHRFYLHQFRDCQILYATDEDLTERHPNNNIVHTHAISRFIVRRPETSQLTYHRANQQ